MVVLLLLYGCDHQGSLRFVVELYFFFVFVVVVVVSSCCCFIIIVDIVHDLLYKVGERNFRGDCICYEYLLY